jgi:hypothetical protein
VRAGAWRHTLERVEAFARHNNDTVTLFPDSGQYDRFRKLAREIRRFSQVGAMVGGGTLSRPLVRFLITRGGVRRSSKRANVGEFVLPVAMTRVTTNLAEGARR